MCVAHKLSRPWSKPEQDIVLGRIFLLYKYRVVIYGANPLAFSCEPCKAGGLRHTVSERNKMSPSAVCPAPLDTNRTGIGGQQHELANAQLASHCPETRCALNVKKSYSVCSAAVKKQYIPK